jgi:hypothetical protein
VILADCESCVAHRIKNLGLKIVYIRAVEKVYLLTNISKYDDFISSVLKA